MRLGYRYPNGFRFPDAGQGQNFRTSAGIGGVIVVPIDVLPAAPASAKSLNPFSADKLA